MFFITWTEPIGLISSHTSNFNKYVSDPVKLLLNALHNRFYLCYINIMEEIEDDFLIS